MKKILALLIATLMVFALVACAKDDTNAPAEGNDVQNEAENNEAENNEADTNDASADSEADTNASENNAAADGAVKVLSDIWANFAEDQKFAIGGGDASNMTMDVPGKYDITLTEDMDVALGLPAAQAANIDDAASLVHMMNGNMFTGAAYHLTEGTDATAFANAFKTNLDGRQWMCGRPEALIAVSFDGYVITAFGSQMNIDNFKAAALKLEGAALLIEEAITE
ncbi:MAG: hypothetical protein E7660_04790 [Ruminococcaceae bacterium]|nr:hypothetical protein [Oscillospiraceae bacterium]